MGNQEPCRFSLFLHPFLFIFSFPIHLFLFSQFNHPFLPFSTILSFPFQPSFPFLAFTIHPSFPSFFISSIIFYLLYPFLNYFISISSFFNFFIQYLIFLLLFYFVILQETNVWVASVLVDISSIRTPAPVYSRTWSRTRFRIFKRLGSITESQKQKTS